MPRYFFTDNARRDVIVHGRPYRFEPVAMVGANMQGVYLANTPEAENDLGFAAGMRMGVSEIPPDEYDALKKGPERTSSSPPSSPSKTQRDPEPRIPLVVAEKQGRVTSAEERTQRMESDSSTDTEAVDDPSKLIRVERVNSPTVVVTESDQRARTKRRKTRNRT